MHKYILKSKLKKIYREKSSEKHFLNWKDIQTVLVLFDTSHFDEVAIFIKQLKNEGKKVTVYAYQKKDDKKTYLNTSYHIILEKEAGKWFNNPVYATANKLKEETFDAVIDLTLRRNISLEYLLACARASIKTGLKKNDFPQYDLAITASSIEEVESFKVRELGKQIVHYLDKIQAG